MAVPDPVLIVANWHARFENNRSAELKHLAFVPLPNALDADEYLEILDHEDGVRHWACWVAILMIASRCGIPAGGCEIPGKRRGPLLRDTCYAGTNIRRPHDAASLARTARIPREVMAEAIKRFAALGMIECKPADNQELLDFMLSPDTPRSQGAAKKSQGRAEKPQAAPTEQNRTEGKEQKGKKSGDAGASPAPTPAERARNPHWDWVQKTWYPDGVPKSESARVGRIARDLKGMEIPIDEYDQLHQQMSAEWDGRRFGPEAFVKWAGSFRHRPARTGAAQRPGANGRAARRADRECPQPMRELADSLDEA